MKLPTLLKVFTLNALAFLLFGTRPAFCWSMSAVVVFLLNIPEPGKLALVGLCLIGSGLIVRKVLTLFQPALGAPDKAGAK